MAYRWLWVCMSLLAAVTAPHVACAHDLPNDWEAEPFERADLEPYFAALKDSQNPTKRAGVLSELARIGGERGLRAICEALADEAPEVRRSAARELAGLTEWPMTHATMLPALLARVREEQDIRALRDVISALQGIVEAGGHDAVIAEALTDRLTSTMASGGARELFMARSLPRGPETDFERELASCDLMECLGDLGSDAGAALPAIRELTASPLPSLAVWARGAAIKISGSAPDQLAAIEDAFRKGRTQEERAFAAQVLGWLGPAARPCVPALVEGLNDKAEWREAALALRKIGMAGEKGVEALARIAWDEGFSDVERKIAVWCMGYLRADRELVVPILIDILGDEKFPLRAVSAGGLGRLGLATHPVLDALLNATDAPDHWIREGAASALGELAARPDRVVPVLVGLLDDESWDVRFAAVRALASYPNQVDQFLGPLRARLSSGQLLEAQVAVRCLGRLGPAAKPAVAELRALRRSCEEGIASAPPFDDMWPQLIGDIDQALEAIGGSTPAPSD